MSIAYKLRIENGRAILKLATILNDITEWFERRGIISSTLNDKISVYRFSDNKQYTTTLFPL
jgi:hypothetical protein